LDSRQALQEADFAPLLMTYVQLTGDASALDEYGRYITGPWNFMENAPPEARHGLADGVVRALEKKIDIQPPSDALLRRMMSTCVGQPVPDEYMPLLRHEMQLAGTRQLEVRWRRRPADARLNDFKVAIIGAGESGLCAGIKLLELGIPFVILEKNQTVGGTWLENDYPGCGVDTPNHFYCYSFEPNHDWSRHFSPRQELWQYLERCADKYGVRRHIRFGTEVTEAVFETDYWKIKTSHGDLTANAIICAVGQLNRPYIPDIKGLGDFAGAAFHTARWDHGVSLEGRKVAMIGTGASGMQVAPSIASGVERLTIFQRSPHWAIHNPNYHNTVSESIRWALKNLPFYAEWYRFQLFWASSDGLYDSLRVDPDWPTPDMSLNATNHGHREKLIAHIRKEVNDDPDLLRKAVPSYPPYGKRMLRDNHWYRMLTRPNVDLVTEPIERVEKDTVITSDGKRHPAEVLILATGFQAFRMTWPMRIAGRGGRTLRELWGDDDPRAYLGITVPGFPNFFMMYGPNTNLAHGGSAIFHSECQTRYALLALREMLENGWTTMEVRQEAHDAFNRRVDEIHGRMVWAHRGVGSWYKNQRGRVFATSPWRLLDYWNMTRSLEAADYDFKS
jgi:4-hydroxyacetophenone monooxygenase